MIVGEVDITMVIDAAVVTTMRTVEVAAVAAVAVGIDTDK